jgi:maltose alpha-D-glucosyltransferase/alpha-amylase
VRWVGVAYVAGYVEAARAGDFLPPDPAELSVLLEIFLLEKAVYELGYELSNRPDWIGLPLRGILDLLGEGRGA